MPRLFLDSLPAEVPSTIRLSGDDARYIANVLRMRTGDSLMLFSQAGLEARAIVDSIGRGSRGGHPEVALSIVEALPMRPEPLVSIVLVQAMLKGEKMELVIQKSTELGVCAIAPVVTERSQVRETRKLSRWRKIALDASRQSGRPSPPEVREPEALIGFLSRMGRVSGVVFHEDRRGAKLDASDLSGSARPHLLVGPEGGFTKEEVEAASDAGFLVRGLGDNVLRAETAAIVAVSLAGYLLALKD